MTTLRPLYLQLHTWTKYKLAEKYHQPVPKNIPAHWINNRWSQEWAGLVEAANSRPYFKGRTPEWIIKTAEQFYTGLGFSPLPASFWTKSDLYPVRRQIQAQEKHSCFLLAYRFGKRHSLAAKHRTNPTWFFTAHHELGHGYYFKAYTRPEVPYLLTDRSYSRLSRRNWRTDFTGVEPGALSAIARHFAGRFQSRQNCLSPR